MDKSETGKKSIRFTSGEGGERSRLGRFLTTVVVLVIILLVAFVFIARTDGFRSLMEGWLEKYAGTPVVIGTIGVGLPYTLVMENVESQGLEPGLTPGFRIGEVRLKLGLSGWSLQCRHGELYMVRDRDGLWSPTAFSRLGPLPEKGLVELSRVIENLPPRLRLEIRDSSIQWMEHDAREMAFAGGIVFETEPVRIAGRPLRYHQLTVYNMLGSNGVRMHNVGREWLASRVDPFVLIGKTGEVPASDDFWEKEHD